VVPNKWRQDYFRWAAPIQDERCVVNPGNRGVRWAFVWLAPAGKKPLPVHPDLKRLREKTVTLHFNRGRFRPHLLALRQGQDVRVKNPEPWAHNLNWVGPPFPGRPVGGNVLIPAEGSYTIKGFKASRLPVSVRDNIYPWMGAWLRAFDHPYFAVTDAKGRFTIPKAPAGTYRLVAWQEVTGWGPGRAKGTEIKLGRTPKPFVRLVLKPPDE
jgi:hypothetical protein